MEVIGVGADTAPSSGKGVRYVAPKKDCYISRGIYCQFNKISVELLKIKICPSGIFELQMIIYKC